MVINLQGLWHYDEGKNNQDFVIKEKNMVLVLDGCSESNYSEVGTRLFGQYFKTLNDYDSEEKFEKNVNLTFEKMIEQIKQWYPTQQKLEDFIRENLLFTILACFEKEDKWIVKIFGDGYIVTQNIIDEVSYIALSYGDAPPYFAYKYCNIKLGCINQYKFKTFIFDNKKFKKVGVATDGIKPIARGTLNQMDSMIVNNSNNEECKYFIKKNRNYFNDDVTIGIL